MLVFHISIMTKTFLMVISRQILFAQVKSVPYLPIFWRCQGVRAVDVKFWTSRWPAFRWAAFLIDGNEGTCTGSRRDAICVISRGLALGHINIATFFWSLKSKEFECPSFHRLWKKSLLICWCCLFLSYNFRKSFRNITAITLTDSLCVQRTARQRGEYYDDTLHTAAARLIWCDFPVF